MTRKGEKKQLKRTEAPIFWDINRKANTFTVKPSPGPHAISNCIPILTIMRDLLHLADTAGEAKKIISAGNIKVDGVIRKNYQHPVGLMDVFEIPKINLTYRVIPAARKGLILHPIEESETQFKLCRIENKVVLKGGHIQLNLHDGRNILVRVRDPTNSDEDSYNTKDVLKIGLPKQDVLEHIKFDENIISLVIAGRNVGLTGKIIKINKLFGPHASTVTLESDGKTFETALEYAFPIGLDNSIISLPH